MSGIRSSSLAIWLAAIVAFVNFIFTFVGLYLVEKIGRRPLTIGSLIGTAISLAVLAVGFQLAAYNSPLVDANGTYGAVNNTQCLSYKFCDSCIQDDSCGYCYNDTTSPVIGSCLPSVANHESALYAPCNVTSDTSHWVWAFEYCPTMFSWMAIFGLVLYLACFAPGMGPMPWTINSEIYPLWARSTGTAAATSVNWISNLFISLTFLTLTEELTRYGAFWLYTGFAFLGVLFMFAFLPETKGKSLEEVEQLFKKPWCRRKIIERS